jgi:amino-acid N-acetyltransferase
LDENKVVGAIGLERYENCGLLRSLVVNPDYRNERIAGKLVERLENKAIVSGIDCVYLLTQTALEYFAKKGYEKITRSDVPDELKQSSEFTHSCLQTAVAMRKQLR